MVEIQGIQNAGNNLINNQVSSDVSTLRADSLNQRREDEIRVTSTDEESSDEDVVAVDLSTVSNQRTQESSLPDLVKSESNVRYVTQADLAASRQKIVQASESSTPSADTGSNGNTPPVQPDLSIG